MHLKFIQLAVAASLIVSHESYLLAQAPAPPGAPPPGTSLPRPAPPTDSPPLLPTPTPGNSPVALVPPLVPATTTPLNATKPIPMPPPQPELVLTPHAIETALFTPGVPNLLDLTMAVPNVEVWRAQSNSPQILARHHRRFELAYLIGKEPVTVRLRFDPRVAGQAVVVRPGPGVTVNPAETAFHVGSAGECVFAVALDRDFVQSDVSVSCAGVKTKVPLSRGSPEVVEAREAAGRDGR